MLQISKFRPRSGIGNRYGGGRAHGQPNGQERVAWSKITFPETYPLLDNFDGRAKATCARLGFIFATGRFGRVEENVQVGAPRPIVAEDLNGDDNSYKCNLGAYISEGNMAQLYAKSIEAEEIRDGEGIPFQIFHGVSNNIRAF